MKSIWVKSMCKKSFWVKSLVEKYSLGKKYIGEKYVQETFLGEESLTKKYIRVKKNRTQLQVKFQSSSKTLTVQLLCLWVALHAVGPGDKSY